MKITKQWLKEKSACDEGVIWFMNQKKTDGLDVLKALIHEDKLQWANWLICRLMDKPNRVRYAIFAALEVIAIYEKRYPKDLRPRKAIEAAQAWLDTPNEQNAAASTAASTAADAAYAASTAADATAASTAAAAAYAAATAADAAASTAADAAASTAADAATAAATAAYAAAYAAATAADAAYARKQLQLKILTYGMGLLMKGEGR